jgi:hypothetical protein
MIPKSSISRSNKHPGGSDYVYIAIGMCAIINTPQTAARPDALGARRDGQMTVRRVVLLVTCMAVMVLGGLLSLMQWNRANRIATAVSALSAVAAVGVAVWAAPSRPGARIRVRRTGEARSGPGGTANTGLAAPARGLQVSVEVERTGDADASGGGNANTGINLT